MFWWKAQTFVFASTWPELVIKETFLHFQLLFCLQRYQGDEKIKTFIWDLIKPRGLGEESTIARNHSGLHNLVPRGRNAKGRFCLRFDSSLN